MLVRLSACAFTKRVYEGEGGHWRGRARLSGSPVGGVRNVRCLVVEEENKVMVGGAVVGMDAVFVEAASFNGGGQVGWWCEVKVDLRRFGWACDGMCGDYN